MSDQLEILHKLSGVEVLVTDRHGEKMISFGNFAAFRPDVVNDPGVKLRVVDRTVAHIYLRYDRVEEDKLSLVSTFLEKLIETYESVGMQTYYHKETAVYADELEAKLEKETYQVKHGEKNDELTGVLNRTYFDNRLKIVDRSQIAPVSAICININDWKFVNDNFGDEESDRLIQIIAGIISKNAKPEYIIGRVDGDVFNVLIPMPEDGESEEFCATVKADCEAYEDAILAPSVAIGNVLKENVEEKLTDKLADAEYEMFEDKFEMKNAPGYRERLTKGLK
jgi:diguanylate cyclase (GGDEF)-like protein